MTLGLRTKIVLIVSGVALLALSAIMVAAGGYFAREYTKALQSRALAIGVSLRTQLERVLRYGIGIENLIGFEEQCRGAVRSNEDISYTMVALANGRIQFHSEPARHGEQLADPALLAALEGARETVVAVEDRGVRGYAAVVPVALAVNGPRASVVVGFPEQLVRNKVREMLQFAFGAAAIVLAAGIALLLAALAAFVTRPLRRLIGTIEQIHGSGADLSRRVSLRSSDELGRLAAAFNYMMDDLEATTVSKTELEARERRQAAVAELGRQALSAPCGMDLFKRTTDLVTQALGAQACAILRPVAGQCAVTVYAGTGWCDGVVGSTFSLSPVRALDDGRSPLSYRSVLSEHGLRSEATQPIGAPDAPFGTLAVYSATPAAFTEEQTTFLQSVANVLSAALRRAEDEEAIQRLASTDGLTGLANRRRFGEALEHEFRRTRRYGFALSVIIFDVDHFKRINDTYGHLRGDEVLRSVAQLAKGSVRSVETVARWGGEEFALLVPQTELEEARRLAERLRRSIAEFRFAEVGQVTASFGVAALQPGDNSESLIRRTDVALYRAKQAGRNRVMVAEPVEPEGAAAA
jgi:diguanylate cyclase (GGDEF)-like protein